MLQEVIVYRFQTIYLNEYKECLVGIKSALLVVHNGNEGERVKGTSSEGLGNVLVRAGISRILYET